MHFYEVLRDPTPIISEWRDLFAHCSQATPFQSPEWLLPWWRYFGRGSPVVVTARVSGRLAGLGLFYIYDEDRERGQQLFFMGKSASDYLDILVADGEPQSAIAQGMTDCLFDWTGKFDCADFDRIRPQSPLLSVKARPGIRERRFQEGACPELHLQGTNLREITTKNTRNAIRKHRNRARMLGRVEFIRADKTNFESLFCALVGFHSGRWRSVGKPGVFSDGKMTCFLREAGMQLLESEMLQLHAMLLNDEPVAVAFGMLHGKRNYFYLCDFNLEYAPISPGTLVTAYAMEQAIERGAEHFDFLQGEETYKYQKWGAQSRPTWRIQYSFDPIAGKARRSGLEERQSTASNR